MPVALICALEAGALAQSPPSAHLDALIQQAVKQKDQTAVTRLRNLKNGLATVKPSELKNVRCGNKPEDVVFSVEVEIAKDKAGELLTTLLEKVLPTLAAALASTPAAAIAAFLTPQQTAADPVEILNSAPTPTRSEVAAAARQLLQTTTEKNFANLPTAMKAKIVACAL
jgi:hypothetical protein